MSDIYSPNYLIGNIANISPTVLKQKQLTDVVFTHASGILTARSKADWFPYAEKLRSLGSSGIAFYLLAQNREEAAIFRGKPQDRLDFEGVIDLSKLGKSRRPIYEGIEELAIDRTGLLAVGTALSDIAQANRAGAQTVLMSDLRGAPESYLEVKQPFEAVARKVRKLPFRASAFPATLTRVGQTQDQETAENTSDQTQESTT